MSEAPPPFQPVGPIARWRVIYDLLQPLKFGEILTYETMGEALKLNPELPEDRHVIQMSARRALRELLNTDHRGSKAVTNVGYRIAKPEEHLVLAKDRNKRAGRQISTGHAVSTKVDRNGMDPATQQALEVLAKGFARQGEINRRVLAKQEQHDEAIDLLMKRVKKLEGGE
jgi:hypothetical protein